MEFFGLNKANHVSKTDLRALIYTSECLRLVQNFINVVF